MDGRVTLAVSAASLLAAALAYAAVAALLGRRRPEAGASTAHLGFRAWWAGLAAANGAMACVCVLGLAGFVYVPAYSALFELFVLGNALAVGGLAAHLLAVFAGRDHGALSAAFGLAYFLLFTAVLFQAAPHEASIVDGSVRFDTGGFEANPALLLLLAAFYLPHAVASFAYASLLLTARGATERYRLVLIASSILLSTVATLFVAVADGLGRPDLQVLFQGLATVSPLSILLAYAPPRWLQRAFGVVPLARQTPLVEVGAPGRRP